MTGGVPGRVWLQPGEQARFAAYCREQASDYEQLVNVMREQQMPQPLWAINAQKAAAFRVVARHLGEGEGEGERVEVKG